VNELIPAAFENQPFNIMDREGKPWFAAKDIAAILENQQNYRNNIAKFPKDEVSSVYIIHSGKSGKKVPHKILIISLAGVFRLIFQSQKPVADRFKNYLIKNFASNTLKSLKNTPEGRRIPRNDVLPGPDEKRGGCFYVNGRRVYCYKGEIYPSWAEMGAAIE
jgi:prophage antirepressor-like protein